MIKEPSSERIEGGPISTRKKELNNVSSQKDIMTSESSFPHAFLIPDFGAALLFEKSARGLEPSTGRTRHAIERLEEAITIFWILAEIYKLPM